MARLPKEDIVRGGGRVRDRGFAIADVGSAKANFGKRRGCEGSGPVVFRFRSAGAASEAR